MLYPLGTYPWANPLVFSDDGTRLFFGQCFNDASLNGVYQFDLETEATTTIVDGIEICSSNSMDFRDETLYTPRIFENRIVKIDLANNNTVTDVSTGLGAPNAVKFDSQGTLHALDSTDGSVYRINLNSTDKANNRELVATAPFKAIDNLAFDKDDRLYISSVNRATVLEVLGMDNFRTVSPGILSVPFGVAVLSGVLYTLNPNAIYGYNAATGDEVSLVEPVIGTGGLQQPTSVVAWKDNLLLQVSVLTSTVVVWNVETESADLAVEFANVPTDVHPFGDSLLVTGFTGDIVQASGPDFVDQQVIATIPSAFFLAGDDSNVFVSNFATGSILQIISDGIVLDTPLEVSSGHVQPEGIALYGEDLLVVSSGTGTLEKVDLSASGGEFEIVADGLGFQPPLPGMFVFGFPNDVAVFGNHAFVNGDGANVIYKIDLSSGEATAPTPSSDTTTSAASEANFETSCSHFIVVLWGAAMLMF
jgi:hypothetical protein